MKHFGYSLAFLCFAPVLAIPAHFVFHLPQEPWKGQPVPWLGSGLIPLYTLLIFTFVPFCLVAASRFLFTGIGSPAARGLLAGLAAMLWCDTVLISVPSTGIYFSYPSVMAAWRFSGDDSSGRQFWVWVFALNAALWLTVGIAGGLLFARRKAPAKA